jgi:3-carboxy-cis,cis-muconate cycloisomerase
MVDPHFSTAWATALFAPAARVQYMLDFEAALARAQTSAGCVPAAAARTIAQHCSAAEFDIPALLEAARAAGNLAIPLVAALTERVAAHDADAARWVHRGATSQDVLDTALVLQLREACGHLDAAAAQLDAALVAQIEQHRRTPMAARTWLQHAAPTTFGLKLAGSLVAVRTGRHRLARANAEGFALQFGGAVGTLAALGEHGPAVEAALAQALGLPLAPLPWHSRRDGLCDLAAALAGLIAALGKLARDIALLAQSEVGEVAEPAAAGRGGSSTLPQKRNPVGCAIAIAAATRAPGLLATMYAAAVQEHERGLGNWPAEWDTLPDLVQLAAGALEAMVQVIGGLEVNTERMRANLDLDGGLIMAESVTMALAPALGRVQAKALVEAACHEAMNRRVAPRDALSRDPRVTAALDAAALDRAFDPTLYLGSAQRFIDRALAFDPRGAEHGRTEDG